MDVFCLGRGEGGRAVSKSGGQYGYVIHRQLW